MDLKGRIADIRARVDSAARRSGRAPGSVTLLAVTKTFPAAVIQEAYDAGLRLFGENRVAEALEKQGQLPPDCQWHLIGQLQTNKINKILGRFRLIQSIDSLRLARALSQRLTAPQDVLLEVNSSGEAAKAGFAPGDLAEAFAQVAALPGLNVRGLMTVGPLTPEKDVQRRAFGLTRDLFLRLRSQCPPRMDFSILSMGMSGDFEAAIEEGSTLVRVGSALLGPRA